MEHMGTKREENQSEAEWSGERKPVNNFNLAPGKKADDKELMVKVQYIHNC